MSAVGSSRQQGRATRISALEARLPPHYRLDSSGDSNPDNAEADVPKRPRVRYMPPLDAPRLSQVATMSGFLKKQADNEPGKWTEYYFVLKPTTYLYYYNTQHDGDPRGIIDLEFLRDVRFTADCVQRSVGGSPHGFRLTGQLPSRFCDTNVGNHGLQLRPVYLDAVDREKAQAWMDAIQHHRFDIERFKDYDDLLATMDKVDERMTKLMGQIEHLTSTAQRIERKGREYLCRLRNEDVDKITMETPLNGEDAAACALRAMSMLFDDVFAERQREQDHFQQETQLRATEADLKIYVSRCEKLERELESAREERQVQEKVYEGRYADIVSREHHVEARERELDTLMKQRDREFALKMQEMERHSAELATKLQKDTALANGDLEKRRKQLDKQQRVLDKKLKQIDNRSTPTVGIVRAVQRSLSMKELKHSRPQDSSCSSENESHNVMPTRDEVENGTEFHSEATKQDDVRIASDEESIETADKNQDLQATSAPTDLELSCQPCTSESPHEEDETNRVLEARFTSGESSRQELDIIDTATSLVDGSSSASPQNTLDPIHSVSAVKDIHRDGFHLPSEWTCKESKTYEGQKYYFNLVTGETRWDMPQDITCEEPANQRAYHDEKVDLTDPHGVTNVDRLDGEHNSSVCSVEDAMGVETPSFDGDTPTTKPKSLWKTTFLAKVQKHKTASISPPRSLLDGTLLSETQRCAF